ncbi:MULTISPECIES: Nif3-like dinuclear metal center hexameric protein [unclassified Actinopolyspora]|uniref:Nif3-like dinuclear metal center hexameric protein n=1 Tax=unclassified Actinopolyspora TaxID=2639451 RepID=UPI0013F5BDA0|nr:MULTISPECIES: Nif3-like dinuclear metal center hexameric protein [unclassified Actinopolyspora]NHD18575.1 Nif3-like dinuclear metal center hexameric protein [Actinopolyspora sp. BKK2]NHE77466.1 Nif3-like dinuclear metal center hexameric protein [Actinopolyspora sp. BKK1]
MTARIEDVVGALETSYPPDRAESWDAVGLVCGDPAAEVRRVAFCVDPVEETVDEAIDFGAQLLVAHHPLLLSGVHGVPADDHKGRLVHRMIRSGLGLYCAHTNADTANPGVSDALAAELGITVTGPLHPHREGADTGLGRIGTLAEPEPFERFVRRVAERLPGTAWGVRGAGDPQRPIERVAVCGGSGDSNLDTVVAAGADAYVTADLRHHPAAEHLARQEVPGERVPNLVDVAHWASEWPWCRQAADIVTSALPDSVEVLVSTRRTDPWTVHAHGTATTETGRMPE